MFKSKKKTIEKNKLFGLNLISNCNNEATVLEVSKEKILGWRRKKRFKEYYFRESRPIKVIKDTKIEKCIEKGIPVIKLDIDKGLNDFMSSNFDLSIMARSIQCLKNPDLALNRMLELSKRCVVTLPNLGYWRCRINLASGKMPITPELPSSWYETENIHLCTIKDFENLCLKENISIKDKVFINRNGDQGGLSKINPNLFAVEGVYLLEK